jgi:hypothetical protein
MPHPKTVETSYIQHLSFRRPNCSPGLRLACKAFNSRAAGPGCVFCEESTYRSVSFVEKPNKVGSLGDVDFWIAIFRDSEENMMGLSSMAPWK